MAALLNVASISSYATSLSPKTAVASYNFANFVISHPFWIKFWGYKKQAGAEMCQAQDSFCYDWLEFVNIRGASKLKKCHKQAGAELCQAKHSLS